MDGIITAVIVVAGMGLILGIGLGVASVLLQVKVNEKEQKLLEVLPGANCGACSFAGCADYAKALAGGNVKTTLCPVGGEEGVKKICAILGVEVSETKKKIAFVQCQGTPEHTKKVMEYEGIKTCYASRLLCMGEGSCTYGCNGFGDCIAACNYGAISIIDGVAKIDCSKCIGCGLCVIACPKKVITMVYAGDHAKVGCRNTDKGAETRKICSVGCIGCGKCVKTCPNGAIIVSDNRAVIDMDKCYGCGSCAEACPTKAIVFD
jgi:RnfABCDGE-type electron transport complex B subunit